jgi:S1-C subfamily serine protease
MARRLLVTSCCLLAVAAALGRAEDPRVKEDEARRVAVIARVRPAVVAVFDPDGQGGGSGVLISPDGYALTNYHVVGNHYYLRCGLPDGVLYDAVLVGLDMTGDVALIKLLPKEPGKPFPFAPLGDSDKVQVGDWTFALGNPFLLATDFTPTVTAGIVSGTHRYQYPAGTILEYTDCIQVETSINPGNSGGPLFNVAGQVIGINGRGSFDKRGRVNSGVGYAISINQIKNFLGHLKAGINTDHATLGALARTDGEGRMVVTRVLESADAHRRGLREDDELVSFAGRQLGSINQFKNVLGIYPKGWRLPMVFRHEDEERKQTVKKEVLVRLAGVQRQERLEGQRRPRPRAPDEPGQPRPGTPRPGTPRPGTPRPGTPRPGQPKPDEPKPDQPRPDQPDQPRPDRPDLPGAPKPDKPTPVDRYYEAKPGYANFYFNKLERRRLEAAFKKHGDFAALLGPWSLTAAQERPEKAPVTAAVDDATARIKIGDAEHLVEPLAAGESVENLRRPKGSGGLLVALYQWRRLLTQGEKGFEAQYAHGGVEPFYPQGTPDSRVDAEVLLTEHGATVCKWYFRPGDGLLLGCECYLERDQDPCELTFSDYKDVGGRQLPHRLEVRYADKEFGAFVISGYQLADKPAPKPADTKPGEAKPGEAKPGEAKPGEAKPGESK